MATRAQCKLGEVAALQLGITFRGADAARHDPNGTHRLIRIGDVSEDGEISPEGAPLVWLRDPSASRAALNPGDVILASRGSRMTAALFDKSYAAVVGSQFCIARPDLERLIPEYLWWFFNLPTTQEYLLSRARGSYVRSLPVSALGELEIPVPTISKQRSIARIHALRLQEKALMAELGERRTYLLDQTLLRSAKSKG